MKKFLFIIKGAPFASILAICSFIFFIVLYLYFNVIAIEPSYLGGLLFLIPFIIYSLIAYFESLKKLNKIFSNILSFVLIFILGYLMIFAFFFVGVFAASTQTTNPSKYEKVLRLSNFPENELLEYFPKEISENATNIKFRYYPALGQGGTRLELMFQTDPTSIDYYITEFSSKAIWIGKFEETLSTDFAINEYTFRYFGYKPLPDDFDIYIFASENFNHGKLSLVAISESSNTIIFLAERW